MGKLFGGARACAPHRFAPKSDCFVLTLLEFALWGVSFFDERFDIIIHSIYNIFLPFYF